MTDHPVNETPDIPALAGERARNLFLTRQLLCAEAVLVVINQGLGGGLSPETAVRLTSGLPEGVGGTGCLCGAVNGGVLALGLFLGRKGPGFRNRKNIRALSGELIREFKERYGATCCRVLTRNVKNDSREHFEHCAEITAWTTRETVRLILENRLISVESMDIPFLKKRDSRGGGLLRKLFP